MHEDGGADETAVSVVSSTQYSVEEDDGKYRKVRGNLKHDKGRQAIAAT